MRALIRRAEVAGASAFVVRKGKEEAGAMILKLSKLDGTCLVLNQARDGKGELVWAQAAGRLGRGAARRALVRQTDQIRSRSLDRGDRGPRRPRFRGRTDRVSMPIRSRLGGKQHMTQHQALQFFLPILIILPLLYFRMRRMTRAAAAEAEPAVDPARHRSWSVTALVLLAPPPPHHPSGTGGLDWVWLGWRRCWARWAAGIGASTMAIDVHPEDGTLMVRGGQAGDAGAGGADPVPAGPARRG